MLPKVMTIFGTRPAAIKMAPLVKALEASPHLQAITCVTAQHREMLDQVLELFAITPDYDLDIMRQRQSLNGTLRRALEGLERVFEKERPDLVLVHGDTLTTFAGALAAFYQKTAVGHVEAGLRTFDKYLPFPEEINRRLTGVLADLHFAPTNVARDHLLAEGVSPDIIYVTGNTVIDALRTTVRDDYTFICPELRQLAPSLRTIVVTLHRRENWGEPIAAACRAIKRLLKAVPDAQVVFAVHLNPIVRETVFDILGGEERVLLVDPLVATDYHNLVARSYLVLSDSGGVQEEAPSLGKPVLVVRTVTERPEAVEAGTVRLVGIEVEDNYQETLNLLTDRSAYEAMAQAKNPYGDGFASQRIVQAIEFYFGKRDQRPADYV
ncbi:MAG: UDP-N-acetylglucosamine 2-epimerase (non-hydrolyzing) [Firmicutes bacterium]|nr:UDP-N-acetylglucosamine 2-epimerase (non-hydrolyzing) [Bacillota bacterium]